MSDLTAVTDAIKTHIGGFRPTSGIQLDQFFTDLPGAMRDLGAAFSDAAEGMTSEHIHPAVIDMLRELAQTMTGVADVADQTYQTHRSEHALWLNDH